MAGRGRYERKKIGEKQTRKPPKLTSFDTAEQIAKLLSISGESLYKLLRNGETDYPWHG